MTTDDKTKAPPLLGPLTADEWVSLARGDEDQNSPLPVCCAEISEVRDAIFETLRAGADPDLFWRSIASVWDIVEAHPPLAEHPTMRKLYAAYVQGRVRPNRNESFAYLFAQTADQVGAYLDLVGVDKDGNSSGLDVSTREGQVRALASVGGRHVAYILDPGERDRAVALLAARIHLPESTVELVVDVLRDRVHLPYQGVKGDDRD